MFYGIYLHTWGDLFKYLQSFKKKKEIEKLKLLIFFRNYIEKMIFFLNLETFSKFKKKIKSEKNSTTFLNNFW